MRNSAVKYLSKSTELVNKQEQNKQSHGREQANDK